MSVLRWLHLSDFHTGKDSYGQRKLFKSIHVHMKEQKEKGVLPDLIFITGDIANQGKQEEYMEFSDEFLLPLVDIYDSPPKIYIVPGNHDVSREKCSLAASSLYSAAKNDSPFFDTDEKGLALRQEIFDRFSGFRNGPSADGICVSAEGIFEKKAFFCDILRIGTIKTGIVGIHTAWLSNSDNDKEQLACGKWIMQEALEALECCDYKIILGHHPLDWLQEDERRQISTLFAKHRAIYLHGHLHKNSGGYSASAASGFLSLQCGAAFQARENEIYYNSLYWGELDASEDKIRIMPRRWSAKDDAFVLDASGNLPEAFRPDGSDTWVFPCSFSPAAPASKKKAKKDEVPQPPAGWDLIDEAFLRNRKEPEKKDILKFFDGREPSYNDIFSSHIPLRKIVFDLQEEFIKCNANDLTKCILLSAAGGEGKTTILLQTVRELCMDNGWRALILRQPDKDTLLHDEQLLTYTKEGNWIIGVDNCFPVAQKLFGLMKKLKNRKKSHVHFLLCTRDTDWINSAADKLPWHNMASFGRPRLKGISEEDAGRFVRAWEKFGDDGLGKLRGLNEAEARKRLLLSSQNEESSAPKEGALLGAMLATRYGDDLHNHVREMLRRLEEMPLRNRTLLDAFSYIVAMHSEKLFFLSKTVMSQLYGCNEKDIKKLILGPLGDEAASAVSGDMIYTRHASIATSARKILDEEFRYDFDELFIELVQAAIEAYQKGKFVERLSSWEFLSDHFKRSNNTLAVRIDRKVLELEPCDTHIIVHLSKLYRNINQPELAVNLFRNIRYPIDNRPFFCEWALVEANVGNKAASICLSAIAMSDDVERKLIDLKNAHINLYSIALTFLELHRLYGNEIYFSAMASAQYLDTKIALQDAKRKLLDMSAQERSMLNDCLKKKLNWEYCLKKGVLTAFKDREIDFWDGFPDVETLKFNNLFSLAR